MSTVSCLPFPDASYAMHSSRMPPGVHSYLHRLYRPNGLSCIFSHHEYIPTCFVHMQKRCFRFHSEQWWYRVLKLFSILPRVIATAKLLHISENQQELLGMLQKHSCCRWCMLFWRPFIAHAALPAAGSRALALPGGGSS